MHPETNSSHSRVSFAPLKQKRRFKTADEAPKAERVLINANMEIARHRQRMPRSGHLNLQWHRVPSPIRVSEVITPQSRSPILAQVVDKVKNFRFRQSQTQGIWSLLRCWALAGR